MFRFNKPMIKNLSSSLLTTLAGILFLGQFISCSPTASADSVKNQVPFFWDNANIYFLLTDRFYNGDTSNDLNYGRDQETALLRGFEGGDIKGVIKKLEEGYFHQLGITALWLTPFFEQNHGATDESTGMTYGYHGYWIQDWTHLDPNFGTGKDLEKLVKLAHQQGIRIVMDVVMNHTGPVTEQDPVWPETWVRTKPTCTFTSYETTVTCTLVKNLPDIRTESDAPVELPAGLLHKWKEEGRLEQELAELDAFFERTGYPRAPRFYLIKWLTDYIRRYGIDGYRLDTAKHIEESVWAELLKEAQQAFEEWKLNNPDQLLDQNNFFMVGEVYGYGISSGREFWFGDRNVDFYAQGIHSLINFEFKQHAHLDYESLFSMYSEYLHGELRGQGVLNYISSHDDGDPFDQLRERPMEALTKLLLTPGSSQLYYGDETSRELVVPGANGDANLRCNMNWEEIGINAERSGYSIREVLDHAQKLGQFRREHPAVGAGLHQMISASPYVFSRTMKRDEFKDRVVVALEMEPGIKNIELGETFPEGTHLYDYYSGTEASVQQNRVQIDSDHTIVLLGISGRE
jgi:alpha-amylase